ncbi:MAG TPA: tetratricopeptide repeat protein [Longimicrobiaceae bacterium]|nr:tetratricopeptide repeat protein [Longimicrobiaceae bacterium]
MKPPAFLLVLLLLAACGRSEPPRRTLGAHAEEAEAGRLAPAVQAQVDSGNLAYRAGDYAAAMRHYREAVRRAPDQAVPWFGVAMAAEKLGDRAAADSARARVRALSPQMQDDAHHPGTPADSAAPGAPET